MWHRLFFCAGLAGCFGGAGADNADGGACGDSPPTFDDFTVVDIGEAQLSDGVKRAVQLTAMVSDPDGDLHNYTARVWIDGFRTGSLPDTPTLIVNGTTSETPCAVSGPVALGARIAVEDPLNFGQTYDFGLVILDAAGNASNGGEPLVRSIRLEEADELEDETDLPDDTDVGAGDTDLN